MSIQARPKRLTVTQVRSRKGGDKLVCLTAYTASVARLIDHEVDLLLVGDSLAMTVYGFDSTLPVTLDMMIAHGASSICRSAAIRNRLSRPFAPVPASWPRPAAPRSSSKAARRWQRR